MKQGLQQVASLDSYEMLTITKGLHNSKWKYNAKQQSYTTRTDWLNDWHNVSWLDWVKIHVPLSRRWVISGHLGWCSHMAFTGRLLRTQYDDSQCFPLSSQPMQAADWLNSNMDENWSQTRSINSVCGQWVITDEKNKQSLIHASAAKKDNDHWEDVLNKQIPIWRGEDDV